MRSILLVAVLSIAAVTLAADEPKPAGPKNPAALSAIAKHEKTLADAAQAYQDTKRKADQELVVTLKKVQADVMKGGGPAALAESNAIQATIDRLSSDHSTTSDLRSRLAGTKWTWSSDLGEKNWFVFNANGTITCGWHKKLAIWTSSDAQTVFTKLGEANHIQTIRFDSSLRTAEAVDEGGEKHSLTRLQ